MKNKTMKIIDLLILVYEDKAPKFVIYDNNKYEYDAELKDYKVIDESYLFATLFEREANALSKTVEIIEDKPKLIDEFEFGEIEDKCHYELKLRCNELAKAVNYLLEESDKSE